MLQDKTLGTYLEELASGAPTPGGGAAAALTVAQAAALLEMVCNLTLGKKAFAEFEDEVGALQGEAAAIRIKALALGQEDTAAFGQVMAAYKQPQGPGRDEAIEQALKGASEVPFALFNVSQRLVPIATRLNDIGNPKVLSDVEVGHLLAVAGLKAARVNVEINLSGIKDQDFCKTKRTALEALKA